MEAPSHNCLPMCSLCCRQEEAGGFKKCGACKTRTYCSKKCQILDWKMGGHKLWCGEEARPLLGVHQPWCAYLDRNPELDNECLVQTNQIQSNPRELITTGMNTCIFIVIKTTSQIVGWHASVESFQGHAHRLPIIRETLGSISKSDFVSGFIVPGEDRESGSLDLKPTCRTMRVMPFTDPTHSRCLIMDFLKRFGWYESLQIMPPVTSYKDFVVFDMVHKRPYAFSDVAVFNQGCSYDAATEPPLQRGRIL